jgi:hypothetical protein
MRTVRVATLAQLNSSITRPPARAEIAPASRVEPQSLQGGQLPGAATKGSRSRLRRRSSLPLIRSRRPGARTYRPSTVFMPS